jgi:hypothetical protein
MGQKEYDAQDVAEVLTRFADKRKDAISGYCGFVEAGLSQGRREDLRGGGLIRSMGGIAAMLEGSAEERELSDERILGGGDFVESVLRNNDKNWTSGKASIDDVLKDVSEKSGISREQILGPSRNRRISKARKKFFYAAHERAGATFSMLGRLSGRSHVAVSMAIAEAKAEKLDE